MYLQDCPCAIGDGRDEACIVAEHRYHDIRPFPADQRPEPCPVPQLLAGIADQLVEERLAVVLLIVDPEIDCPYPRIERECTRPPPLVRRRDDDVIFRTTLGIDLPRQPVRLVGQHALHPRRAVGACYEVEEGHDLIFHLCEIFRCELFRKDRHCVDDNHSDLYVIINNIIIIFIIMTEILAYSTSVNSRFSLFATHSNRQRMLKTSEDTLNHTMKPTNATTQKYNGCSLST